MSAERDDQIVFRMSTSLAAAVASENTANILLEALLILAPQQRKATVLAILQAESDALDLEAFGGRTARAED